MAQRRRVSSDDVLKPVLQVLLCGAGLLVGLATGVLVIFITGLWNQLDRVLGMPLHAASVSQLIMAVASFVVVIGCGWVGTRWGMAWAAKLED
jgi:amino acid permease